MTIEKWSLFVSMKTIEVRTNPMNVYKIMGESSYKNRTVK